MPRHQELCKRFSITIIITIKSKKKVLVLWRNGEWLRKKKLFVTRGHILCYFCPLALLATKLLPFFFFFDPVSSPFLRLAVRVHVPIIILNQSILFPYHLLLRKFPFFWQFSIINLGAKSSRNEKKIGTLFKVRLIV